MYENLDVWSRQISGIAALVTCLSDKLSDDVPKEFVKDALYGIESSLTLLCGEMEIIADHIKKENQAEA